MERVIKVEKHWGLRMNLEVDLHTKEEAESMLKKLRAVLNGAEVIEMPSEEEIDEKINECGFIIGKELTDVIIASAGALEMADYLKSKIVK